MVRLQAESVRYHARASIDPRNLVNVAIVVQNLSNLVSWDLWLDDVTFN